MREIDVFVKENYTSEVLIICVFIALLGAARVTIWRPRQDRIVDYKLWNNSFFLCGKQITRILSEEMKVSGHDRVQW